MSQWLEEQKQPPRVVERFWRQVLVSAINEDLERMAAAHGFQVFWLGFLASSNSYQMGIPAVPLQRLYTSDAWRKWPNVRIHLKSPVDRLHAGRRAGGGRAPDGRLLRDLAAVRPPATDRPGAAAASVRALADYRHPPVVRPFDHATAARHAARPDHSVDVQQGRRPLPATGRQRLAQADADAAAGGDRPGGPRAG